MYIIFQINIDTIDLGLDLPEFDAPEKDACYNIHGVVNQKCREYSQNERIQLLMLVFMVI